MSRGLMHVAVALLVAGSLVVSPVFAQVQQAAVPPAQDQSQAPANPAPAAPQIRTLNLFSGQPDYSKGNRWFPNIFAPYAPMKIPQPMLANTPRISQLMQDGKLMLSLDDALSLALDNNLNIEVQEYTPLEAETSILGSNGIFDPILSASGSISASNTQFNNSFFGGGVFTSKSHNTTADVDYTQLFHTGTSLSVAWTNQRTSSNQANIFNPAVNSGMTATIKQPLLNGFGIFQNTYLIIEAKNSEKAAQANFEQVVITNVTNTAIAYWELVGARENVDVQKAAVKSDQDQYENTKKELEVGTRAPLDVITAQSTLATDQQNLVLAQTTQQLDETTLLNDITKNPLDASLAGVEIVPTTPSAEPALIENISIQDAVKEAWKNSPQLQAAEISLQNAGISVKATKNQLLPSLSLSGTYSGIGLSGVSSSGGVVMNNGLGTALSDIFQNDSPTYTASLTFSMPIRNRSAQATNANAMLIERQLEASYRQQQNTIFINVHQAMISLTQDRAALAAADEAVKLDQESYDDELKKFNLGTSDVFTVAQKHTILVQQQGAELRAKINLTEAEWNFNQAMSRTLDVNHITIAGATPGPKLNQTPNVLGAPSADAQAAGK